MSVTPLTPARSPVRRLTERSPAGGCAAKMCPSDLAQVLKLSGLDLVGPAGVLIHSAEADDAAVVAMEAALMAYTIDFMPPVVDDVENWAEIVIANVLSDLYAEGANPQLALAMLQWPADLGLDLAGQLLGTARRRLAECGVTLLGGHTIHGDTPLFGLAAIGAIEGPPTRNSTARPGDLLVLTKAIGTGLAVTAIKSGECPAVLEAAAIESMREINDVAARTARLFEAAAVTDVSGFGLLGHAREMAVASEVTIEIDLAAVPLLPGLDVVLDAGILTNGGRRNMRDLMEDTFSTVSEIEVIVATDPQTSGGLLMAVAEDVADAVVDAVGGVTAVIGRVGPAGDHPVVLGGA